MSVTDTPVETLAATLPDAWKLALNICPYCSGTGKRERPPEDDCGFCAGSGDLFGHLLTTAFRMGRDETVEAMRALYSDLIRAGKIAAEHDPSARQLKARLGL